MIVVAWTDKMESRLRALWPANSAREIASALGVTRNAVLAKARRMQLPAKVIYQPVRKRVQA